MGLMICKRGRVCIKRSSGLGADLLPQRTAHVLDAPIKHLAPDQARQCGLGAFKLPLTPPWGRARKAVGPGAPASFFSWRPVPDQL